MKQTMPLASARGGPGLVIVVLRDALGDAALGHAEEAHVEFVEPLTLRLGRFFGLAVSLAEAALFVDCNSRVAVVGRIAEDDEDLLLLLHVVGGSRSSENSEKGRSLG
jgi:hypothetical protein